VWNAQNRVPRAVRRIDPATQWTYTVATTWRQANANAANEVSVVLGLLQEMIALGVRVSCSHSATGGGMRLGIGEDSTTATKPGSLVGTVTGTGSNNPTMVVAAEWRGWPASIGRHRYTWLEWSTGSTLTILGDEAGDNHVSGLVGTVWA
jgi:hypothetical protein